MGSAQFPMLVVGLDARWLEQMSACPTLRSEATANEILAPRGSVVSCPRGSQDAWAKDGGHDIVPAELSLIL